VIHDGVLAKGMPNWNKRFSEAQLVLLSSYIVSLRGTQPASPREAQGDRVSAWAAPETSATDGGVASAQGQ
jgi:cytochrome c oxidase cbb3-type subunit 3